MGKILKMKIKCLLLTKMFWKLCISCRGFTGEGVYRSYILVIWGGGGVYVFGSKPTTGSYLTFRIRRP